MSESLDSGVDVQMPTAPTSPQPAGQPRPPSHPRTSITAPLNGGIETLST
jgi:hypothetical protein